MLIKFTKNCAVNLLNLGARLGGVMNEMKMILFDGVNRLSMRLNV